MTTGILDKSGGNIILCFRYLKRSKSQISSFSKDALIIMDECEEKLYFTVVFLFIKLLTHYRPHSTLVSRKVTPPQPLLGPDRSILKIEDFLDYERQFLVAE